MCRVESAPLPMKKDPDHNSTDSAKIEALITRIERGQLRDEDAQLLARLLRLLLRLITLLQHKNASLSRLKRLLFGPRSDKRREANSSPGAGSEGESDSASSASTENSSPDTPKGVRSQNPSRKSGHGRMGVEAYTGARAVRYRDAELTHGARCPHDGCCGKLYDTKQPAIFIRLTGQPLVGATRYEQEVLRCSACQERFTAPLPAIALYANSRRHAGENIDELLKDRSAELGRPIQMADALAANWSGREETVEAKCLAHARRMFIDIERAFPVECGRVLDAIAEVYRVEAGTEGMSAQERLERHQVRSGPVMAELREWIEEEFAERRAEPNSSLGQAFRYVLRHWEGLTRFLTVAGVPLDNNTAERALKRAVLLRKNALFYKNEHGASVGAILQSLIETCRLNGVGAWEYLLTLMRNRSDARANPEAYLPWSYAREEPEEECELRAA